MPAGSCVVLWLAEGWQTWSEWGRGSPVFLLPLASLKPFLQETPRQCGVLQLFFYYNDAINRQIVGEKEYKYTNT